MSKLKMTFLVVAALTVTTQMAQAIPYTKGSCEAESRYGQQGRWTYVRGWGWGCVFKGGWFIGADGNTHRITPVKKDAVMINPIAKPDNGEGNIGASGR